MAYHMAYPMLTVVLYDPLPGNDGIGRGELACQGEMPGERGERGVPKCTQISPLNKSVQYV